MTDNLDPESREKLLKGLSAKGITTNVVVVSELVSEAKETAEEITSNMMNMLMSSGTKKKQGYLKDTTVKAEVDGLLNSCESIQSTRFILITKMYMSIEAMTLCMVFYLTSMVLEERLKVAHIKTLFLSKCVIF